MQVIISFSQDLYIVIFKQVKKDKEPEVKDTLKQKETVSIEKPEESKFPWRKSSKPDEVRNTTNKIMF